MKKLLLKTLKIILPLVLGVFILYWVYRDFDFSKLSDVVQQDFRWEWMLLALFFGVWSHIFRGWRWNLSLAPLNLYPRKRNSVYAVFIAYAANLVIPRVGEVSRCGVLAKYDKIPFSLSLGTLVTERLIDTFCVLFIVLLALLFQFPVFISFFSSTGTRMDSIVNLLTSYQFYLWVVLVLALIVVLFFVIKKCKVFNSIRKIGREIWLGIISLKKVKNKGLYAFYTFAIWGCYFLEFYLTFYCFSFTQHLGVLAGLVLFVSGSIAVLVPTPNGAGSWHFAIIAMLVLYGVSTEDAGAFALLVHGIQTLLILLLGIYGLTVLPLYNKNKKT